MDCYHRPTNCYKFCLLLFKARTSYSAVHTIVLVGLITNLILQFKIKENQLKDLYSAFFLIYDLFQLTFYFI